jgi:hypothetical protein
MSLFRGLNLDNGSFQGLTFGSCLLPGAYIWIKSPFSGLHLDHVPSFKGLHFDYGSFLGIYICIVSSFRSLHLEHVSFQWITFRSCLFSGAYFWILSGLTLSLDHVSDWIMSIFRAYIWIMFPLRGLH